MGHLQPNCLRNLVNVRIKNDLRGEKPLEARLWKLVIYVVPQVNLMFSLRGHPPGTSPQPHPVHLPLGLPLCSCDDNAMGQASVSLQL